MRKGRKKERIKREEETHVVNPDKISHPFSAHLPPIGNR